MKKVLNCSEWIKISIWNIDDRIDNQYQTHQSRSDGDNDFFKIKKEMGANNKNGRAEDIPCKGSLRMKVKRKMLFLFYSNILSYGYRK